MWKSWIPLLKVWFPPDFQEITKTRKLKRLSDSSTAKYLLSHVNWPSETGYGQFTWLIGFSKYEAVKESLICLPVGYVSRHTYTPGMVYLQFMLTSDDLWPLPNTIGFMYSSWGTYIPSMNLIGSAMVDLSCLQASHRTHVYRIYSINPFQHHRRDSSDRITTFSKKCYSAIVHPTPFI